MTVGKSDEWNIHCGGVSKLTVSALWEEQVEAAAGTSVIAVTGMSVTAEETGRYTLDGTVSMDGAVLGRLTGCMAEVTEAGVPASVSGACFPIVSAAIPHKERAAASVNVQLSGTAPDGQRFHGSGQISVALTVQPRLSAVTAGAADIGSPVSVAIIPADGKALHTLRYEFGGRSGVIGENLMGGSHAWTPPMELCAAIPDRESEDCEIFCDTYIGGELVGTASCATALSVPDHVILGFADGWLTLEPANEGTAAEGLDCYVQGISCVRAIFDESKIGGEDAFGAVPAAYTMTVGGVTYASTLVSDVLHGYGTVSVTCGLSDSRGRHYETYSEIQVLPYAPPAFGDVRAFRCDAEGMADDHGNGLSVLAGYRVSSLEGRNHGSAAAKLRTVGGEWGEAAELTEGVPAVLWSGEISPNDTYELGLEVVDALGGSASMSVTLPCTNVFFHGRRGGCGAAFGKAAEADNVLEVAWNLKTKGNLVVEGTATIGGKALWEHLYPVGAMFSGGEAADPAELFGGTWEETTGVRHWVRTE